MTFEHMQALAAARRQAQRDGRSKEYRDRMAKASPCYSRKARAKLALRRKDYDTLANDAKDISGFHRPGSGNIRKG